MRPDPNNKARLLVEGPDDLHALVALIERALRPEAQPPWFPYVHPAGGWERLREALAVELKNGARSHLAAVVDADADVAGRWASIRQVLCDAGFEVPDALPPTGLILDARPNDALPRLGIWLMPDNQSDGVLENFLLPLRSGSGEVVRHADASTETARDLGAELRSLAKAKLHCWLSWRAEPGRALGTSGRSGAFDAEHASAQAFIDWMQGVFDG